jgi:hypothetical protein
MAPFAGIVETTVTAGEATVSLPHPIMDANTDAAKKTLKLSLSLCIVSPYRTWPG